MKRTIMTLAALTACTPVPHTPESLRGTIAVASVSQETHVTLTRPDTAPLLLTGALEPELRQLGGAVVTVEGVHVERPRAAFDVSAYDVVEIDGARPVVGVVQRGMLVAGADTLSLSGAQQIPDNAKIWVTGARDGRTFRIASWGIIRR